MAAAFTFPPKFEPGQVVEHKRYQYRGLVVAVDPTARLMKLGTNQIRHNQTETRLGITYLLIVLNM